MESSREDSSLGARAALAEVEAGRSAAARRVLTPWWFLPLQGAALAAMLAAFSLRGPAASVVFWLAGAAYISTLPLGRRLTGVTTRTWNARRRQRSPGSLVAEGALVLLLLVCAITLDVGAGARGAAAMAGVALGVSYVMHERRLERRPTTVR